MGRGVDGGCPVCLGTRIRHYLFIRESAGLRSSWGVTGPDRRIMACGECGCLFVNQVAETIGAIDDMYGPAYHEAMAGETSEIKSGATEESRLRLEFVRGLRAEGTLLDVGCSTGTFLLLAKEAGFETYGIDVSAYSVQVTKNRLCLDGSRIECAALSESTLLTTARFDLITLWDVAEHLADPATEFRRLRDALTPTGLLVLRSPHVGSPFVRLARLAHLLSGGHVNAPLSAFFHHDHFFLFSEAGLRVLFSRAGLREVSTKQDALTWARFSYAERRRGLVTNAILACVWAVGCRFGLGHGVILVAAPCAERVAGTGVNIFSSAEQPYVSARNFSLQRRSVWPDN